MIALIKRLRVYRRVLGRARRRPALTGILKKRPAIMAGVGAYEFALMASNRVDSRLKTLASIKASSMIGCPF